MSATAQHQPSAAVRAKAERLLADGKVHRVEGMPRRFMVEGDTDIYKVTVGPNTTWCDCKSARGPRPAGAECSHGLAGVMRFEAEHEGSRLLNGARISGGYFRSVEAAAARAAELRREHLPFSTEAAA